MPPAPRALCTSGDFAPPFTPIFTQSITAGFYFKDRGHRPAEIRRRRGRTYLFVAKRERTLLRRRSGRRRRIRSVRPEPKKRDLREIREKTRRTRRGVLLFLHQREARNADRRERKQKVRQTLPFPSERRGRKADSRGRALRYKAEYTDRGHEHLRRYDIRDDNRR